MQMQSQHFHTDVVGVCSVVGVLLLLLVLTLINKTVVICGTERSASVLPVKCNQNAKHAPRRALLHFHLQIARERWRERKRERSLCGIGIGIGTSRPERCCEPVVIYLVDDLHANASRQLDRYNCTRLIDDDDDDDDNRQSLSLSVCVCATATSSNWVHYHLSLSQRDLRSFSTVASLALASYNFLV